MTADTKPSDSAIDTHSHILGPRRCETISLAIFQLFVELLEGEARRTGSLTREQILTLAEKFVESQPKMLPLYQRSWDDCSEARGAAAWDPERKLPFDRIVIARFAHMFPDHEEGTMPVEMLSRRMIPGFILALDKMVGPERISDYQRQSWEIVRRLKEVHGDKFDWQHVYDDDEANRLADDILVAMARYFESFEKRKVWFFNIINANMPPYDRLSGEPGDWEMGEREFSRLMKALYAHIRSALVTKDGEAAFAERYGEDALRSMERFIDNVWA